MKKLMALLSAQFKVAMAYRINMVVLLLSSFFPLLGIVLFVRNGNASSYDFSGPQLLTYYLFAYLLNILFTPDIAWEISEDIHSGTMNYCLLLPMNYFLMKTAAVVQKSFTAYPILLAVMGVGAAGGLSGWIAPPSSPASLVLSLLMILLGNLLVTFWGIMLGLLTVWFDRIEGIFYMQTAFIQILSGAIIPLNWLPGVWGELLQWNPFSLMLNLPVQLYLGTQSIPVGAMFAAYLVWLTVFVAAAQWLWKRAQLRYQAYGG